MTTIHKQISFLYVSNKMQKRHTVSWRFTTFTTALWAGTRCLWRTMCKLLCRWVCAICNNHFVHPHVCHAYIHVVKLIVGHVGRMRSLWPVRQLTTRYCMLFKSSFKKGSPAYLNYFWHFLSSESLSKGFKKTKKNGFANKEEDQEKQCCTYWHTY